VKTHSLITLMLSLVLLNSNGPGIGVWHRPQYPFATLESTNLLTLQNPGYQPFVTDTTIHMTSLPSLRNITAIATGRYHTCALTTGGGVKCWGDNSSGQLGDGTMNDRNTPVDVVGLESGVAAIAAGGSHTCALTTNGGVKCWGANVSGQLGNETQIPYSAPVDVVELGRGVFDITAGWEHTCALTTGGGVKCWGDNSSGQLGDGTTNDRNTPVDVAGLESGVAAIAAGEGHTCALTTSGGVKCWGDNLEGQLGGGTIYSHITPVDVAGLESDVAAIAVGWEHTCALTTVGGVRCWGNNSSGQLGDGTMTERNVPVGVIGLESGVTAITAGGGHTCALTTGGGVKCWGNNFYGQLGNVTAHQPGIPVDVAGLGIGVVAIAAGGAHTCALTTSGGVKCWGYNYDVQLGDGTTTARSTPVDVSGLESDVVTITAGGAHTCALTTSGGVKCWGRNFNFQLGDGTMIDRNTPVDVIGLGSRVTAITAGGNHTCALTTSDGVKCWGSNLYGQLGHGTMNFYGTPVDVIGLNGDVTAIAAGWWHTCALMTDGGVKCWGANDSGQLGDGTRSDRSIPVDVSGLGSGVAAITAGLFHTCALTTSGGVKCWGSNSSWQLGNITVGQPYIPVDVFGLWSGVTAITAGLHHTCALTTGSAQVQCWGGNYDGQLGDGTTNLRRFPQTVIGLEGSETAIAAGGAHTCALTVSGGMKCWGDNFYGQLGDGSMHDRSTPVDVIRLESNVDAIAAGFFHTCALTTDKGVKCWGDNFYAQLGDGRPLWRSVPVDVVDRLNVFLPLTMK